MAEVDGGAVDFADVIGIDDNRIVFVHLNRADAVRGGAVGIKLQVRGLCRGKIDGTAKLPDQTPEVYLFDVLDGGAKLGYICEVHNVGFLCVGLCEEPAFGFCFHMEESGPEGGAVVVYGNVLNLNLNPGV